MGKPRKKNIAHKKPKKKVSAQTEVMPVVTAGSDEKPEIKEEIKAQKEPDKAVTEKTKDKKKANKKSGIFRQTGAYLKSTVTELKKVQWLSTDQLMKASGSVAVIVTAFTGVTWIADTVLGSLASLLIGL